jgi:DNA-binding transcriptional LysR family regulator
MKLYQYEYILAVAEERSFTKAAQRTYLAQPTLSQYVMKVERELGVELFDRSSSPIGLTYAGQVFVDTANQIIALQNELKKQMATIADQKVNHFVIAMTPFRIACILPHVLSIFKSRWPKVKVDIITGTLNEFENLARDDKIDLFVGIDSNLNKNLFDYEFITAEYILLAIPPSYPQNDKLKGYQVPLEAIKGERSSLRSIEKIPLSLFKDVLFLLVEPSRNLYGLALTLCKRAGFEPAILSTNWNIDSIFAMTVAELGVSFIPVYYLRYGNIANHAVYYCIDDEFATRNVVVAYKKKYVLPQPFRDFISIMKNFLTCE